MKIFQIKLGASIVCAIGGMLASQPVQAQICPGSHLTYIVRDARGVAIDVARKDLPYEVTTGSPYSEWKITGRDFNFDRSNNVPASVSELKGKIAALETFGMCTFKQPVKLQLTFKGKTMNLTFLVPKLSEYDSRDFLVDSLPFRQGTFEIELPVEKPDTRSSFYPASGWKAVK